jgi:hypothetical protein
VIQAELRFDGATYDHDRDGARLGEQMQAVLSLMADGKPRTLTEISMRVHAPESSVSARLRDLRKERFGGHTVNREYVGDGLFRYQLLLREAEAV